MLPAWLSYVKYPLLFFGILYEAYGIFLVIKGTIELLTFSGFDFFNFSLQYPIYLVVVGIYIIVCGAFGITGAVKESQPIILTFLFLIIISDFMIFIHGVLADFTVNPVYLHDAETNLRQELREDSFIKYRDDWDYLQRMFSCCGFGNPEDWLTVTSGLVPPSCYDPSSLQEGNTRKLYNIGCFHTLIAYLVNGFMCLIIYAWINFILTCLTITCLFMGAVKSRAYNGPAKENILYYTLEER